MKDAEIMTPEKLLPRVTSIEKISEYALLLKFDNGELRSFDCSYLLALPPYKGKLLPVFTQARVEYGTLVWPGDLDLSPETVYLRSTPVTNA